mmetsp:Transcript_25611/g.39307  ORF Transcript_25611/g.39307 Transcript_25611/m.39307 type:complete len:197 (+) Transcript_25611:62-652(+)
MPDTKKRKTKVSPDAVNQPDGIQGEHQMPRGIPKFQPGAKSATKVLESAFPFLQGDITLATIAVCKALKRDDPGFCFVFSRAQDIHQCLAIGGSPVVQGANAAASVAALRAWLVGRIPDQATQLVQTPLNAQDRCVAITNLTIQEYSNMLQTLNLLMLTWGAACHAAGISVGTCTCMFGVGQGSCTISVLSTGAFI